MTFVVLGRDNCTYCDKVKALLTENAIEFTYMDISQSMDLKLFLVTCGLKTVPQVFVDGLLIGGYQDVVDVLRGANT